MSTTTKINYAKETKALIKDGINRLGGDLTNLSTFRSYATVLNAIYNSLPKVSGTGSSLSLSPTLKGGLDITPKGACEQDSYTGKNKATINDLNITNVNKVVPVNLTAGQYTLSIQSFTTDGSGTFIVQTRNVGETSYNYLTSFNTNTKIQTVTLSDNIDNVRVFADTNYQTSQGITTNIQGFMIESGTTATSYEPYVGGIPSPNPSYPQDVRVVTGDNEVVVQNKNLTLSKIANVYLGSNGAFSNSNDYDTWIAQVTQGETYTVTTDDSNLVLGYYTSMPTRYSVTYNNSRVVQLSKTFTAEITGYVSFRTLIDYSTPQLELGSTATTYVPHAEQKVTIHLGTNYLAGIDTYKDTIVGKTDDWKIVRKIHKINFKDFIFTLNATLTSVVRARAQLTASATTSGSGLCNGFIKKVDYYEETDHFYCQSTGLWVFIDKSRLSEVTQNGINAFIQANNFYAYYQLATPTEETITDTTLISDLNNMYNLMGYDEQTNITITSDSNNAQMTASVSALKGE